MPEERPLNLMSTRDLAEADKAIRRAGYFALVLIAATVPAGYWLLPAIFDFPHTMPERLAFAARAGAIVMLCVIVAVMRVATARRKSLQDMDGPAAGPPTPELAIKLAFLQNTLEQAVLAAALYLALATLLQGPWLSVIVVAVIFFVVGRILFLRGYPHGAAARALGMTLTMIPTLLGYLLVVVLLLIEAANR